MTINFADDSQEAEKKPAATLEQIRKLAEEMRELEIEIGQKTERLKLIENDLLPGAMESAQMKSFKLLDGAEVTIKDVIAGSIPKEPERAAAAYGWLVDNHHEELIKVELTAQFGKGDYEKAAELAKDIKEQYGVEMLPKNSVHHMTLSAWAKEQVAKGVELPFELLGLWVGRKANIQLPKQPKGKNQNGKS